jgi:hypothetical protein
MAKFFQKEKLKIKHSKKKEEKFPPKMRIKKRIKITIFIFLVFIV